MTYVLNMTFLERMTFALNQEVFFHGEDFEKAVYFSFVAVRRTQVGTNQQLPLEMFCSLNCLKQIVKYQWLH